MLSSLGLLSFFRGEPTQQVDPGEQAIANTSVGDPQASQRAEKEAKTETATPVFTPEEVGSHTKPGDAFVIVHGKVNDISNFLAKVDKGEIPHPLPGSAMLNMAGGDISRVFDSHSTRAQESWLKLCPEVGTLTPKAEA